MIDWLGVGTNALWIAGLAIVVAALSFANWLAHQRHTRLRHILNVPIFLIPFSAGMALVSLSLFFTGRGPLERICWAVLTVLFASQGVAQWRVGRQQESKQITVSEERTAEQDQPKTEGSREV